MVSVLLIVFVLQLAIHLVNKYGAQRVNELLWTIYTKLPTPQSKDAGESSKLRQDVVRLNREMKAVSAQDDFAKWARIRREHDKAKDKYDKQSADLTSFRTTFDRLVTAARWLGTQGANFLCNTYLSKDAMFWLPQGWVPYHVEWVLSFPRAPMGAVSINIWSMACACVIAMVSEGVQASLTLREGRVREGANKGEKLKMEALGSGSKKEL
ncbi:GET complex subunit get1 [Friedmanniomyces endolithicus]|uniref:GET complex subunit get1 n=2 Tax=Dothideomycetidae TaxID=451867 RepID=A0AAN6R269_9PEZI|nr:GET complex subunit get1 [Friedmanniomyces endolithicus]KAK5147840.1 GET complex subunit get1 [Rachicladosporium monterosium]KAK0884257.1 GET complex subunit get1 [Friedmanniomyces endolithicus]KAK0924215.1 GET complex subunit get1 [Friedmanniomyces endolithicus]KAK0938261.1 GET complex subunit get1 [Friedmanniomyces endolithicus]